MNPQRRLLMNWELIVNVRQEMLLKCIAFQVILHLHLSNSALAVLTYSGSPLVSTKSITVCLGKSMLQLRST